jgi:hypothetical protein
MKRFFITTAVGALLIGGAAATHVAFAQGEDGARMRGGPMAVADANKDGVLTRAELTASLEKRFAQMDVNGDGKITREDREALRQKRFDEMFAKIDADHNGQISKAELQAAHQARMAARKDGGPEGHERGHGMRMGMGPGADGHDGPSPAGGPRKGRMGGMGMHRADANGDSVLTREAFLAPALAMFDRADTNKDGKVTKEEREAARTAMKARFGKRGGDAAAPGGDVPPPPPPAN